MDIENEQELFNYLKAAYIPDLEKSKGRYCGYDCFSKSMRCIIELKCRKIHYDTLVLEKIKYDKLKSYNCKVLYVNSTPKGIFVFDINTVSVSWQTKILPQKTDLHIFKKEITKELAMIDIFESDESLLLPEIEVEPEEPKLYIADIVINVDIPTRSKKVKYERRTVKVERYPIILLNGSMPTRKTERSFFYRIYSKYISRGDFETIRFGIDSIKNIKFSSNLMYKFDLNVH
jgi:hypothetical protein